MTSNKTENKLHNAVKGLLCNLFFYKNETERTIER